MYGRTECCKELLKHPDIDVNAKDKDGDTALHEACEHGHIGCCKELLKHPDIKMDGQRYILLVLTEILIIIRRVKKYYNKI
jgi:ankyrin repeat protein